MTVLQEILEWSHDRPPWQRDALRRLVLNGELSDDDIRTLTEICKGAHGLAEQQAITPLTEAHVPVKTSGTSPVSLLSIFHHRGVNALAEDQTSQVRTSSHRGLWRQRCWQDRLYPHTQECLPCAQPRTDFRECCLRQVAALARSFHQVQGGNRSRAAGMGRKWRGPVHLSRERVRYAVRCCLPYRKNRRRIPTIWSGPFDNLARACRAVRARLESEQRALASSDLTVVQEQIPERTAAARLLSNLSSLTKPEAVQALTRLSAQEEARLALLEKSLLDLLANDPEKLALQLSLRAGRIRAPGSASQAD